MSMQLASAWLILNKLGSSVPVKGMTPAELVLIVKTCTDYVGRFPVHDLKIIGRSKRTDEVEKQRLRDKHGGLIKDRKTLKIDVLYPGQGAKLPETFEELGDIFTQARVSKLDEVIPDPNFIATDPKTGRSAYVPTEEELIIDGGVEVETEQVPT